MDAAKEYLRKTDASGVSVYSHLTEVLATLLARQPANALDMLEGVSLECKSKHYSKDAAEVAPAPPEVPASVEPSAWAAANDTLVKGYAPAEGDASGQVTDVVYEKSLFACAGVGLSESETFRVYASLVALQRAKDLASVRFFGKVLACGPSDYYVAEAVYNTPPEPEEGEPPPPPPGAPVEASGEGCNKYVYFVASDPSGEWVALPDVTPQQIVSSKRIRKFLTGDLEADVKAYPPFPGQEKAYLRAMIARIVAETTLCPAGAFAPAEEAGAEPTPVEVGAEEGQRPPIAAAALGAAGGWVTRYMGVLDIGRCTNEVLEEQVDDEGNPLPKPYQQPEIPPSRPPRRPPGRATSTRTAGPRWPSRARPNGRGRTAPTSSRATARRRRRASTSATATRRSARPSRWRRRRRSRRSPTSSPRRRTSRSTRRTRGTWRPSRRRSRPRRPSCPTRRKSEVERRRQPPTPRRARALA